MEEDSGGEKGETGVLLPNPGRKVNGIAPQKKKDRQGIRWRPVLGQVGLFFVMAETFRITTQEETRQALKGPYLKDYIRSLKGLRGWGDDDPPLTNYVAHPMQGSAMMNILFQNDPNSAHLYSGLKSGPYWIDTLKGVGLSAVYSTFYELGPVGDAAVGNLGMDNRFKSAVDLVITPTVGVGWHLTEDMVDKYFIRWMEQKTGNRVINALARTWLNPTRGLANVFRFKTPWRRDTRMNLAEIRAHHEAARRMDELKPQALEP